MTKDIFEFWSHTLCGVWHRCPSGLAERLCCIEPKHSLRLLTRSSGAAQTVCPWSAVPDGCCHLMLFLLKWPHSRGSGPCSVPCCPALRHSFVSSHGQCRNASVPEHSPPKVTHSVPSQAEHPVPSSLTPPALRALSTVYFNTSWKCLSSPRGWAPPGHSQGVFCAVLLGQGCRDSKPSQGEQAALWPQSFWFPGNRVAQEKQWHRKITFHFHGLVIPELSLPKHKCDWSMGWLNGQQGLSGEQKLWKWIIWRKWELPEPMPALKGQCEAEWGYTRTSGSRNSNTSSRCSETHLKETFLFQKTRLENISGNKIFSSWNISQGLFYCFNLNYANPCIPWFYLAMNIWTHTFSYRRNAKEFIRW